MKQLFAAFALLASFCAGSARAVDYTVSRGALSDQAFYNAVACRNRVPCRPLRWPAHLRGALQVRLAPPPPGYAPERLRAVAQAIAAAIDEINAAHAGVRLIPSRDLDAPITVYPVAANAGRRLAHASPLLNGASIGVGGFNLRVFGGEIDTAHIAIARDVPLAQLHSVVLEELVQSLGLVGDILNPYYRRRSIFAERCNCVEHLQPQDLFALRRHYTAQ